MSTAADDPILAAFTAGQQTYDQDPVLALFHGATLDVRQQQQLRKDNPPVARYGDPNAAAQQITPGDVGGAIVRGLGIPTSISQVTDMRAPDWETQLGDVLTAGTYSMGKGIVGGVASLAAPNIAVARGNAPTRDEQLAAIQSGTSLAALAAGPEIGKAAGALTESIGSRLQAAGEAGVRNVLPVDETPVLKFKAPSAQARQLIALQDKYPQAEIRDDGGTFTIRTLKGDPNGPAFKGDPNAPPPSIDAQARQMLAQPPAVGQKGGWIFSRHPIGAVGGAAVATHLGGSPWLGAEIGAGAAEVAQRGTSFLGSPAFRLLSADTKIALGKALQQGDYALAANIMARVQGGVALDEQFGHDGAVHGLLTHLLDGSQGNQILQDYTAVYQSPDGKMVEVPRPVMQRFIDKVNGTAGQ